MKKSIISAFFILFILFITTIKSNALELKTVSATTSLKKEAPISKVASTTIGFDALSAEKIIISPQLPRNQSFAETLDITSTTTRTETDYNDQGKIEKYEENTLSMSGPSGGIPPPKRESVDYDKYGQIEGYKEDTVSSNSPKTTDTFVAKNKYNNLGQIQKETILDQETGKKTDANSLKKYLEDSLSAKEAVKTPTIFKVISEKDTDNTEFEKNETNLGKTFISFLKLDQASTTTNPSTQNQIIHLDFDSLLSPDLLKRIAATGTANLGELITVDGNKYGNLIFNVKEEEDGKLKYKFKPIQGLPLFKAASTSIIELINLPKDKIVDLGASDNQIIIGDKEFNYSELASRGEDFYIGFEFKTSSTSLPEAVRAIPKNGCLDIYLNESDKIKYCGDLKFKPNGVYAVDDKDKEYKIVAPPGLFYAAAKNKIENENARIINSEIVFNNGKAEYQFNIEENRKLFWIFPIKLKAKARYDLVGGGYEATDYNWVGLFFKHKPYDFNLNIND